MLRNNMEQEKREFTFEEYLAEFCPDEMNDDLAGDGVTDGDSQSEQLGHRMAEDTIRTLMQAFDAP